MNYIRYNQSVLRSDLYSGLQDAILKENAEADKGGKRTTLPSSHSGSPRLGTQNYQDAIAICRKLGYPDLFVTITSNPKWIGINDKEERIGDLSGKTCPDIASRVFLVKLKGW